MSVVKKAVQKQSRLNVEYERPCTLTWRQENRRLTLTRAGPAESWADSHGDSWTSFIQTCSLEKSVKSNNCHSVYFAVCICLFVSRDVRGAKQTFSNSHSSSWSPCFPPSSVPSAHRCVSFTPHFPHVALLSRLKSTVPYLISFLLFLPHTYEAQHKLSQEDFLYAIFIHSSECCSNPLFNQSTRGLKWTVCRLPESPLGVQTSLT